MPPSRNFSSSGKSLAFVGSTPAVLSLFVISETVTPLTSAFVPSEKVRTKLSGLPKTSEAAHAAMRGAGVVGTAVDEDHLVGHLWFEITDPDGHVLKVFSSHTAGRPV